MPQCESRPNQSAGALCPLPTRERRPGRVPWAPEKAATGVETETRRRLMSPTARLCAESSDPVRREAGTAVRAPPAGGPALPAAPRSRASPRSPWSQRTRGPVHATKGPSASTVFAGRWRVPSKGLQPNRERSRAETYPPVRSRGCGPNLSQGAGGGSRVCRGPEARRRSGLGGHYAPNLSERLGDKPQSREAARRRSRPMVGAGGSLKTPSTLQCFSAPQPPGGPSFTPIALSRIRLPRHTSRG
jgi:hypothetical protein